MKRGVLLFAHGARDPLWAAPFEAVAERLRAARPEAAVHLAYLEFMTPDIAAAAAALAADGCAQVEVVPLFLGTGGHVRRDLPALLDTLRQHHAGVAFTLHPPVGEIASVIDAMAAAAARSLDPR